MYNCKLRGFFCCKFELFLCEFSIVKVIFKRIAFFEESFQYVVFLIKYDQVVLEDQQEQEEEDCLEEVPCLHAFSDNHEVILVRHNTVRVSFIVESIFVLKVEFFIAAEGRPGGGHDAVADRYSHKITTCIQVALPIFLHDSVHDVSLHDFECVKPL